MLHGGEIYDKKIEYDFSVNLNPCPCPDEVIEAVKDAIKDVDKYPDISQKKIRKAVAEVENHYLGNSDEGLITPAMVVAGNGASELILAIVRLLAPGKVLLPVPSFYGYRHALNALLDHEMSKNKKLEIKEFFLKEDNDFLLTTDFVSEITDDTDLVILANPNNPTGRCIGADALEAVIEKCNQMGTALLIDECFLHLSDAEVSALKYLHSCDRLFVVSAYTKLFSLPGVRLGYAVSSEDNISELMRCLPEWNLSVFAERAGIECARILIETDFEERSKQTIRKEREILKTFLEEKGIKVFSSETNYLLVFTEYDLLGDLLEKGILIRDCSNFKGLGKGYFRIAVKDADSVKTLMKAIDAAL